jgi:hypothetical protein
VMQVRGRACEEGAYRSLVWYGGCLDTRTGRGRWLSRVAGWLPVSSKAMGWGVVRGLAQFPTPLAQSWSRASWRGDGLCRNNIHSNDDQKQPYSAGSHGRQAWYAALRDKELRSSLDLAAARSNRARSTGCRNCCCYAQADHVITSTTHKPLHPRPA